VDRRVPLKGGMVIQRDAEAPSFVDRLIWRMKKNFFECLLLLDGEHDHRRAIGSWV
jgi:hypothetical protein